MESDLWRGFIAVAETGSFTSAARRLPVSQSGLSQQIRRLESTAGVKLLERSTRSVELTPTGRETLPKARQLVEFEDQLMIDLRAASDTRSPFSMTVFVMENGIGHLLIDIIANAREHIPGLQVEVEQISLAEQADALFETDRPAALIGRPPFGPNLDHALRTKLEDDPICLVVPAGSDLAETVTLDEALRSPRRSLPWLPDAWQEWSPLFAASELHASDVMVANSFRSAIQAVAIDNRPCAAPRSIAESYSIVGETRIVELSDGPVGSIELLTTSADPLLTRLHDAARRMKKIEGDDQQHVDAATPEHERSPS